MTTWQRVISVLAIVVQALMIIVDVLELASIAAGPLGPVLAIIGVILSIVMAFIGSKPKPPLTPTEQWIDDHNGWLLTDEPPPKLT